MQAPDDKQDPRISALLYEREGYERRELPERVKEVDVQLRKLGYRTDRGNTSNPPPAENRGSGSAPPASTPAKPPAGKGNKG